MLVLIFDIIVEGLSATTNEHPVLPTLSSVPPTKAATPSPISSPYGHFGRQWKISHELRKTQTITKPGDRCCKSQFGFMSPTCADAPATDSRLLSLVSASEMRVCICVMVSVIPYVEMMTNAASVPNKLAS